MLTDHSKQRISYVFLCATPFLAMIAAAVRRLRIPGVYHVIGGVLFAGISIAAWTLGARAIRAGVHGRRQIGLAGALLVALGVPALPLIMPSLLGAVLLRRAGDEQHW